MTNETIASQLAHRTIRAYKDQPLTEEEVTTLMEVARHTATSSFLQSCTILHITDPKVREAIGAASGQPYVGGTKGDLFIFVADLYRNSRIRAEQGVSSEALGSINLFLTALEDALLAAQNAVVAAESMGLGTVYLGSILADPRPVVQVLELPELTFPVLGLLVGHPDQEPGQKPRMPLSVTTDREEYVPARRVLHADARRLRPRGHRVLRPALGLAPRVLHAPGRHQHRRGWRARLPHHGGPPRAGAVPALTLLP